MENTKDIKDIIRAMREDKDLKQVEIATVLGIAQQSYSKYENGEHDLPIRHLKKLAQYYNVSTDYLLGLSDYSGSVEVLQSSLDANSLGKILSVVYNLTDKEKEQALDYMNYLLYKRKQKKHNP